MLAGIACLSEILTPISALWESAGGGGPAGGFDFSPTLRDRRVNVARRSCDFSPTPRGPSGQCGSAVSDYTLGDRLAGLAGRFPAVMRGDRLAGLAGRSPAVARGWVMGGGVSLDDDGSSAIRRAKEAGAAAVALASESLGMGCPGVRHRIQADHGILTPERGRDWTEDFRDWTMEMWPDSLVDVDHYYEWPLPRIAALRNLGRARRRAERILSCAPDRISFVAHSNGAVLAVETARILIEQGVPVESMVLMAPALRAGAATRELVGWLERGMLGRVMLVRALEDGLLSWASRWRVVTWPWGSLGVDGWDMDVPDVGGVAMWTTDVPGAGHGDLVSVDGRWDTFAGIVWPALAG